MSIKRMFQQTQDIMEGIQKFAEDALAANERADLYRQQYQDTLDKFELLQRQHEAMLSELQFHKQHQEKKQRPKPKYKRM